MIPEIIIHNSISLDNAIIGFDIDIEMHYGALLSFEPDAVLAGSETAKSGIDMFMDEIPKEEEADRIKPDYEPEDRRPVSIIVDSRGNLKGLLHIFRRMEYTKDVIVLISPNTPRDYISYLEERDYEYVMSGDEHVNLRKALEEVSSRYGIKRIASDSGGRLNGVLINEGLAGSLSLLMVPVIASGSHKKLFEHVEKQVKLELVRSGSVGNGVMHLVYRIV